jgi:prepilin-type N-terminal cleavage/methylation domain-containing protein
MPQSKKSPQANSGFTLIEIMVIIVIISIMTALLAVGFPVVQRQQQIKLTETTIVSQLKRAEQLALDETRDDACLQLLADQPQNQTRCSDIGVNIDNQTLTTYADIDGNDQFTPNHDYVLNKIDVPTTVTLQSQDFLYHGAPPTIQAFVNGAGANLNAAVPMTMTVNNQSVSLTIFPYGYVQENK